MTRVVPTHAARSDLVAIRDYSLEQFGPEAADLYFLGFDEAFDLLSEHPLAGAAYPNLGTGMRCLTHRRHRLLYRVEEDVVLIVRIVHHAMDAQQALKGEAR